MNIRITTEAHSSQFDDRTTKYIIYVNGKEYARAASLPALSLIVTALCNSKK